MAKFDFYGNLIEPRLNETEIFENQQLATLDATKFRYHARTKVGSVPVAAVASQLRLIAKILEESKVKRVTFTLTVDEVEVKPQHTIPAEAAILE